MFLLFPVILINNLITCNEYFKQDYEKGNVIVLVFRLQIKLGLVRAKTIVKSPLLPTINCISYREILAPIKLDSQLILYMDISIKQ